MLFICYNNVMSKISIIIPNHNKAQYIAETLASVRAQIFQDWEAIIVDDASTDDSVAVIEKFITGDGRFKLIRNDECKGGSASRNIGIKNAIGGYVMFLDSDDILTRDCLQRRYEAIVGDRSLDCVIASMGLMKDGKKMESCQWVPFGTREDMLKRFLAHKMPFSVMQPLWRKAFVERVGGFDEKYPRLQDVEFHTRAFFENDFKYQILGGRSDCYYRIDDGRSQTIRVDNMTERKITGMCYYVQDMMARTKLTQSNKDKKRLMKSLRKTVFSGVSDIMYLVRTNKIERSFAEKMFIRLRENAKSTTCVKGVSLYMLDIYFHGRNFFVSRIKGYNYLFRDILSRLGGGVIDCFGSIWKYSLNYKNGIISFLEVMPS